jgi:acylphosphatase
VREARRLGLAGWVRNRRAGTVEAMFIGPEPAIRRMLAICRQGPILAVVEGVAAEMCEDDGSVGFREQTTA